MKPWSFAEQNSPEKGRESRLMVYLVCSKVHRYMANRMSRPFNGQRYPPPRKRSQNFQVLKGNRVAATSWPSDHYCFRSVEMKEDCHGTRLQGTLSDQRMLHRTVQGVEQDDDEESLSTPQGSVTTSYIIKLQGPPVYYSKKIDLKSGKCCHGDMCTSQGGVYIKKPREVEPIGSSILWL
ncbi:hypothetical protein Tco_0559140 [Tanacetum coccineum]